MQVHHFLQIFLYKTFPWESLNLFKYGFSYQIPEIIAWKIFISKTW